jgi:hypothetical protein
MKERIQAEIKSLKESKMISDPVIENTLLGQLPSFLEYVQEYFNLNLPNEIDINSYAKNPNIITQFKSFLFDEPFEDWEDLFFKRYLLQSLYSTNPDLAKWRIGKLWATVTPPEIISGANEAKANLLERININKELESKHWQGIKEALPNILGRVQGTEYTH